MEKPRNKFDLGDWVRRTDNGWIGQVIEFEAAEQRSYILYVGGAGDWLPNDLLEVYEWRV